MEVASLRLTASPTKILQINIEGVNTPPGYMTPSILYLFYLEAETALLARALLLFPRELLQLHVKVEHKL